jgi:hypothetical protein
VLTSAIFLVPWSMLWIVLLRAMLVEAGFLPRTCHRCGLPQERAELGETICRCC